MSSDVTAFGKLKKIDLNGLSIEEKCKEMCTTLFPKAEFYRFQTTYSSWEECLLDNFYGKYIIHKGSLYKLDMLDESSDDPYFCKVVPMGDDEFVFAAHYYNGGCCLEECLEEEMNKLFNSEKKSSEEWQKLYPDVYVIDPDGWDRKNFIESWQEPITLMEYERRLSLSSVISSC